MLDTDPKELATRDSAFSVNSLYSATGKPQGQNCFIWHPRKLSFRYVRHWPHRSLQTEIQLSDKIVIPGSFPSDMLVSDPISFFKPRFILLRQLLNETKNDLKPSNTLQNNIGRQIKGEIFFNFWSQNPPKMAKEPFVEEKNIPLGPISSENY